MKLSEYIEKFGDKQVNVDKLSEFIIEDKVFVPKVGDTYWYISSFGKVRSHVYSDLLDHDQLIKSRQVYRTEAEVNFAIDKEIFLEFMRKEFLRNSDVIDWGDNNQEKFSLEFDYRDNEMMVDWCRSIKSGGFYTTSENWLQPFIDNHYDDIKKYYFEVE